MYETKGYHWLHCCRTIPSWHFATLGAFKFRVDATWSKCTRRSMLPIALALFFWHVRSTICCTVYVLVTWFNTWWYGSHDSIRGDTDFYRNAYINYLYKCSACYGFPINPQLTVYCTSLMCLHVYASAWILPMYQTTREYGITSWVWMWLCIQKLTRALSCSNARRCWCSNGVSNSIMLVLRARHQRGLTRQV